MQLPQWQGITPPPRICSIRFSGKQPKGVIQRVAILLLGVAQAMDKRGGGSKDHKKWLTLPLNVGAIRSLLAVWDCVVASGSLY